MSVSLFHAPLYEKSAENISVIMGKHRKKTRNLRLKAEKGCGEQYFLGVAFCSITQYYEANGIYTSACSRYLLKEERTCDGLIFLSKYQCISSARLCGSIPTTRIYSHLPASVNKRLKRRLT